MLGALSGTYALGVEIIALGKDSRETAPLLNSDIKGKTVLVLVYSYLLP